MEFILVAMYSMHIYIYIYIYIARSIYSQQAYQFADLCILLSSVNVIAIREYPPWANARCFIIYINDMPLYHEMSIFFADDAKLCKSITHLTDSTLLQYDLDNIHSYMVGSTENHLSFNISKCVSLGINHKCNTNICHN